MLRDEAAANAAIDRLERVNYEPSDHRLTSSILLVKESLRRSALWGLALECPEENRFFDIARRLAFGYGEERPLPGYALLDPEPEYRGVGADPLEDRILALRQHLRGSKHAVSWQMERCLLWHLRWVTLAADPAVVECDLPAPYEPAVVLYERGGWFQRHHGEFIFYPLGGIQPGSTAQRADPEPVVSLDPIELDRIDAEPQP